MRCLPAHTFLKTYFNAQVLPSNDLSIGPGDTFLLESHTLTVTGQAFPQQLSLAGCLLPGTRKFYHHLQEGAHSPAT